MSSQPAPALVPQPESQLAPKEIPELTDAYRKAHKSYVLASGLLASWELIGITLQTKEKWGIELKSPAAVPLILFTLVIYSGYKTSIEWWQCNSERRKHPAAKWDYRIAHTIAVTAIFIALIQYLLRIQIVDLLARHAALMPLTAALLGSAVTVMDGLTRGRSSTQERTRRLMLATPVVAVLFVLAELSLRNYKSAAAIPILAVVFEAFLFWSYYQYKKRPRNTN